jgi:putative transposase
MMPAKKKWRKLSSTNQLPLVIQGVEFKDGIKLLKKSLNQAVTRFWA